MFKLTSSVLAANFVPLLAAKLDLTEITTIISWIAVGVMALLIVLLCVFSKKLSTRTIVMAGICIAASFGLSFLKISPVNNGGSVTAASLVPLLIFSCMYGFFPSLLAGIIYGLLQFLQSPWVLTPFTFLLDFVLAFSPICVVGAIKDTTKNNNFALLGGTAIFFAIRFIMHFASGIIYFEHGAIYTTLPQSSAFVYSLLYQVVYIVPDFLINFIVILILLKTKTYDKLEKIGLK